MGQNTQMNNRLFGKLLNSFLLLFLRVVISDYESKSHHANRNHNSKFCDLKERTISFVLKMTSL